MKALYRKYRSKSLDEVKGQEHITETLSRVIKSDSFNHAYLFTGPRGVGKTSVARILAHELNKVPYDDDSMHLDIIEIDAASNRRIDDIRDLREKVHISPVSARFKVYIIDEAHMLTGESFNALLKTLEEPPSHVIFILATTEFHKLPATIVSRTQRFHFRPVPKDKVISHLSHIAKKENITVDKDALAIIAENGEGSLRDSISILDQLASMNDNDISLELVEQVLGLAGTDKITKIINLVKSGKSKELHSLLVELESRGVNAPTLSDQLIRTLKGSETGDAFVYDLIDNLIDISKSTNSWLKLFVVLLKACSKNSDIKTDEEKIKKSSSKAINDTTYRSVAELQRTPSQINKTIKSEKVTAERHEQTSGNINPGAGAVDSAAWNKVLIALRQTNPPLYSIIKKCEPRFSEDKLTIAAKFKLHKNKLEDSRYRLKLLDCIKNEGLDCPEITMIYDPDAVPVLIKENPSSIADETTTDVLAMMGGGEIVHGQS